MKRISLLLIVTSALSAQTLINGGRTVTGKWDASGAAASKPAKTGNSLPATCGIGEQFFNTSATAGQNLYFCTAANVWTQVSSGAISGTTASYTVLAGPYGGPAAAPSFRTLGKGDMSPTTAFTDQSNYYSGGTQDFSNAYATVPAKKGASLPANCNTGEFFFNTSAAAGQNLYLCSPANTWTAVSSGGGGAPQTAPAYTVLAGPYGGANATAAFRVLGKGDVPPTTAFTDQTNIFSAGTQDFSGASATLPARRGSTLPVSCNLGEFFFNTSAAAGQNLYLCAAANTWSQVAPAAGGGGGPVNSGGLAASAPACSAANAGLIYFPDDSPYQLWCNGSAWKYRFSGAPVTPAVDASFSWVNQGTASTTVSGGTGGAGAVGINAPGGGNSYAPRMRVVANSATAFTLTGVLAPNSIAVNGNTQGVIGLVAISGSYFVTFEFVTHGVPSQPNIRVAVYSTNFPNPSLVVTSTTSVQWFPGAPLWMRLQTSDSITFTGYLSTDHGANWQNIGSYTLGNAISVTQVGWFLSSDQSDRTFTGSLLSWQYTTP